MISEDYSNLFICVYMKPGRQATKFGDNDRAVAYLFPTFYIRRTILRYLTFIISYLFQYCSGLIPVLVSLQNYSSLFVVPSLPLYRRSLPFQWNEGTDESFLPAWKTMELSVQFHAQKGGAEIIPCLFTPSRLKKSTYKNRDKNHPVSFFHFVLSHINSSWSPKTNLMH